MRCVLSGVSRSVAVLAVLVGGAGRGVWWAAEPARLRVAGGVPHGGRDVHIRSPVNLTLTGPGIYDPLSRAPLSTTGVAVFDFNAVTVASDQVFVSEYTFPGVTTSPLAILSRGDVTIDGGD